ncbi:phage holin family protein [Sphingopyxis sp. J-6]|uniref:phage holin family protein n=1 Tax=Sphingopyxis sp. J-6 TaxID=3122054 RepID=UPI003983E649
MPSPDHDTPPSPDQRSFDGISHGYAPGGRPITPPPVPLEKIVGDVVDNLQSAAEAELTLLKARGALAYHGVGWTSAWGFVAACALLVAMLALAFGAILVLAQHIGPLLATLIVFAVLLAIAAFAGWRARLSYGDVKAAFRDDLLAEGDD